MPKAQEQTELPALSAPARRALASAGIASIEDLAKFTLRDIERLHGVGPNAITNLQKAMADQGLAFAPASSNA